MQYWMTESLQTITKHIIIIIIIIITSNDDPKPSTVISEQLPTGLIARHIKITPGTIIS